MTRKLIEVALPLEAISAACRRDKDRKTGTIKNVHKWFAPMPTPAWRALLFAAVVDDPGEGPERDALLDLVARLVPPEGTGPSAAVLQEARSALRAIELLPTILDPFCGGGSTVVEAMRLGLPAIGSDLNPVPVLISKVLCELLPAVARLAQLSPDNTLAETGRPLDAFVADARHYSERIGREVLSTVEDLYPSAPGGGSVVAWLWARTVQCRNPACAATMPLYNSGWLSKKRGEERWLKPIVNGSAVRFQIGTGSPPSPPLGTKLGRGARFRCLVCGDISTEEYVKSEGQAQRIGSQLLCTVVDRSEGGRQYIEATEDQIVPAQVDRPADIPGDIFQPDYARWFSSPAFGMGSHADLYTNRQLIVLSAIADGVASVADWVRDDGGSEEQARAVAAVLGLCVGKLAQSNSTQVRWNVRATGASKAEPAFGRHALPMVWDFAEANPFGASVGSWSGQLDSIVTGLRSLPVEVPGSRIVQSDARNAADLAPEGGTLVATDPPYFSHIGYADLSDYFYIWHRRALKGVFPELYGTIATPKAEELIAASYRHGGSAKAAESYFVEGYSEVFARLSEVQNADFPMIVVYAHRQEESDSDGLTSGGWDAMLEALLAAGLGVVGTWPVHATRDARIIGIGTNALASYIVLVCRPRPADAGITDRQGFIRALRAELPEAVRALQAADTLPFDMTQAIIGPGMSIYSRFSRVVEPDGQPMRVKSAIALINQVRSAVLSEQDDEFDPDTRWAIQWFERFFFDQGAFGDAEKLFTATATSLDGLKRTGIVGSKAPNVWLIRPEEMPPGWDPVKDQKTCTWEVTMHLLRALHHGGGEYEAASILAKVDRFGDLARDLTYRLADICEGAKRASIALLVNGLIASWPEISRLAAMAPRSSQERLL